MTKPKRITDGWYIFEPHEDCSVQWLDVDRQVVQVIEGRVWATYVFDEVTIKVAKSCGTFIERIDLYKGRKS